ncbi:MAG: CapA family protein [Chloroflexi bacterium]|nr:CapA family protein [Chloroflexota bacterium]
MNQKIRFPIGIVFAIGLVLCSCESTLPASVPTTVIPTTTPFQPFETNLFLSSSVPESWARNIKGVEITSDQSQAAIKLILAGSAPSGEIFGKFQQIFAVAVAFPTVTDEIPFTLIRTLWEGSALPQGEYCTLLMTKETELVFSELWGPPSLSSVQTVEKDQLILEVWKNPNLLSLIPFEEIEPRLKILRVDGMSPLDRKLDVDRYPLTANYYLTGSKAIGDVAQQEVDQLLDSIPRTNRDESKMTVLVMTGTTALTRLTTYKIDLNGYEYPVELIKDWFLQADLRHVSHEVSFDDACVYRDAFTMQFCAKTDQIKVLENLGINIVELTGNHLNDYGSGNLVKTIQMYTDRGWLIFGGGLDQKAAQSPLLTEHNGNKIAFIGCNPVGFTAAWATEDSPGAAKCDLTYYNEQIQDLKAQGFVVIATFQYQEIDAEMYEGMYRRDFQNAARSGADIVQGSQAHVPMGFEFIGNSLIHYGLGNFIFDQMEPQNIREFIDRHIIYNGKYINTELLTAKLVDWTRPTPMTEAERVDLLTDIFKASKLR